MNIINTGKLTCELTDTEMTSGLNASIEYGTTLSD